MMFMLIASDPKKYTVTPEARAGLLPISQGSSVPAASTEPRSVVPVSVVAPVSEATVPEATGLETAAVNETSDEG